MNSERLWWLFALGSALFAGLTAILGKLGVSSLPADLATFIRTIVILLVSALAVSLQGQWRGLSQTGNAGLGWLVLSGITTGASWLCYFRALKLAPASRVAPIDKLSVVVAILLGVTLLGEPLDSRLILGSLLIIAGVIVLAT